MEVMKNILLTDELFEIVINAKVPNNNATAFISESESLLLENGYSGTTKFQNSQRHSPFEFS